MAATAALRLLEACGVAAREIGRVEVGTETGVDRSKSVASFLMQWLGADGSGGGSGGGVGSAGGLPVMCADNVHGCFGGTAALLHAADWVAGPSWDGRFALVVASDIAVYEEGSAARATGERERECV